MARLILTSNFMFAYLTDDYPELPDFLVRKHLKKDERIMSETVENETVKPKVKPKVKSPKAKAVKKTAKAKKAVTKTAKRSEKSKAVRSEKDTFGLRKGSTKSQAAAMYARKSGATLAEVKDSVGSIQLNVLNNLAEAGFVVDKEKQNRKEGRPVFRYWLRAKK